MNENKKEIQIKEMNKKNISNDKLEKLHHVSETFLKQLETISDKSMNDMK